MRKYILTLAAGALVAGFATQTFAGEGESHGEIHHELFSNIDANSDGNISSDEVTTWFGTLDADGDGQINEQEFGSAPMKENKG